MSHPAHPIPPVFDEVANLSKRPSAVGKHGS